MPFDVDRSSGVSGSRASSVVNATVLPSPVALPKIAAVPMLSSAGPVEMRCGAPPSPETTNRSALPNRFEYGSGSSSAASNGSCDEKKFLLRSFDDHSGMNELAVIGGLGETGVAGVSGVVTQPPAVLL